MSDLKRTEDGRYYHRFRQSWLSQLQKCPEMARQKYFEDLWDGYTDSTAGGQAMHTAIEALLTDEARDLNDMHEVVEDWLNRHEWRNVKWNDEKVFAMAHGAVEDWWHEIRPNVELGGRVEPTFLRTLHEDETRVIVIGGTKDYVEPCGRIWDWKTAARDYESWEKQRWDVQPTVYCWDEYESALDNADGVTPINYPPFVFGVMLNEGGTQIVPVHRNDGNTSWLREQCLVLARWMEAGITPWPLNDGSFWCSPKWCPAWDNCKGKHMQVGWDKAPR